MFTLLVLCLGGAEVRDPAPIAARPSAPVRSTVPDPAPIMLSYDDVLKRVMAGEVMIVAAGVPAIDYAIPCERIPGEIPGIYQCFLDGGVPSMVLKWSPQERVASKTVPAVTGQPFRGIVRHSGHDCPNCGYEQQRTPITNYIPGGHVHTCPKCRTSWWH